MEELTTKPTELALKCIKNNLEWQKGPGKGFNCHRKTRKITNQFGQTRVFKKKKPARVVKLADTPDLKSVERKACEGSSPSPRTKSLGENENANARVDRYYL